MRGLMMDYPLTIPAIVRRAETLYRHRPVSGRRQDRSITKTSYAVVLDRVKRLAVALKRLGVKPGDRIATLAWASQEHLEAYLAIPTIHAVLHTLNLRLHPDDLAYIVNDAGDRVIIVDECLLPLLEKFRGQTPSVEHIIVIATEPRQETDGGVDVASDAKYVASNAGDVASGFSRTETSCFDYESLIASADLSTFVDAAIDENDAAAMCYTSGTTGRPKGVLYSHRSIVLHSFAQGLVDALAIGECDVLLPIVPMFHVNAWGLPFTGVLFGCGLVFPGPYLDGASVLDLIVRERVTLTAGVPTVWLGMLQELDREPGAHDLSALRTIAICGRSPSAAVLRRPR
jgi:fatty-acyl-CoA synthase